MESYKLKYFDGQKNLIENNFGMIKNKNKMSLSKVHLEKIDLLQIFWFTLQEKMFIPTL